MSFDPMSVKPRAKIGMVKVHKKRPGDTLERETKGGRDKVREITTQTHGPTKEIQRN